MPKSLERVAYHEAGHAVVDNLFRHPIHRASIVSNEDMLGHVQRRGRTQRFVGKVEQFDYLFDVPTRARLESEVMCMFAGVIAERRFTGKRHNWQGARSDLHEINGLVGRMAADNEFYAYRKWLKTRAENIIYTPWIWSRIEAVAKALLDEKQMSGRRVREVINAAIELEFPGTAQLRERLAAAGKRRAAPRRAAARP